MRRNFYTSTLPPLSTLLAASAAQAQSAAASLPLPASDAVLTLDVRTLFAEVIPRSLASDKTKLAQVNADVDEFKARTGIDAREFDTLLVGARIVQLPSGATKIDHATAVARGRFREEALLAAARAAAKGGLAEQKHAGQTVYVATVNDRIKLFGLAKMHVK